jgi:hypothetical protein
MTIGGEDERKKYSKVRKKTRNKKKEKEKKENYYLKYNS